MTATFPPTQPFPFTPDPVKQGPSGKLVLLILGTVLIFVGAAATAVVLLTSGSDYPDEWDERVAEFIPIVEEERGLEFKHPVYVDFRSEKDFRKDMTADEGDLTDEDREEIEQTSGLLRALGLLKSDVDLFKEMNALTSDGTLGFYSFEDKRIRVRGEDLTPAVAATLVHELTHALQDQHFDLGKKFEELDEGEGGTAASVYRGVVEGDASRVETAYFNNLPTKEQNALLESEEGEQGDILDSLEQVPQILTAMLGTPYALGEPFVALAYADGGNKTVGELFENPPSTEEHLMDPWTWLADEQAAVEVDKPTLAKGDKEFDSGEFGALFLYFVLAERLPLADALDAADGWGGDHYVGFTRGDVTCMAASFVADTDKDLGEIHTALTTWSKALPAGAATVMKNGRRVRLESCDSKDSRLGSDSAQDALQLVAVRSSLSFQLIEMGASEEMTRCYSDAVVHEFTVDQLIDPDFGTDDPAVTSTLQSLGTNCS